MREYNTPPADVDPDDEPEYCAPFDADPYDADPETLIQRACERRGWI